MLDLPKNFWKETFDMFFFDRRDEERVSKSETAHRVFEFRYWQKSYRWSIFTTLIAILGALAAIFAWIEARLQGEIARDTFIAHERAVLNVTGLIARPATNNDVIIVPVIQNSGTTPTKSLKWDGNEEVCKLPFNNAAIFPKIRLPKHPNQGSLGPDQESRALIRHTFSRSLIQYKINKDQARIFVFGTLEYKDFFSETLHRVRYCYGVISVPNIINKDEDLTDVHLCGSDTNCTDEECGDEVIQDKCDAIQSKHHVSEAE